MVTRATPARFMTTTGVAPSATANTYGTATTLYPTRSHLSILAILILGLRGNGTFGGGETLTLRVRVNFRDGATITITWSTTDNSTEYFATATQIFGLHRDERFISTIQLDCQSSINNSLTTAAFKVAYLNSSE